MNNLKPYIPVSCATHSEYELLIMHREEVQLHWQDENGVLHSEKLLPTDLKVKSGEEFLIAINNSGQQYQVRLDQIQQYKIIT